MSDPIALHCIALPGTTRFTTQFALHYQAQHVSPHSFLPCNRQYSEIAGANTLTYLAASASAEFLADIGWARINSQNQSINWFWRLHVHLRCRGSAIPREQ